MSMRISNEKVGGGGEMSEPICIRNEGEKYLIRTALEYVHMLYEHQSMIYHEIGHLIEKFGGNEWV